MLLGILILVSLQIVVEHLAVALRRLRLRKLSLRLLLLVRDLYYLVADLSLLLGFNLAVSARSHSFLLLYLAIGILLNDNALPVVVSNYFLYGFFSLPFFFGLLLSLPLFFQESPPFSLLLFASDLAHDFIN